MDGSHPDLTEITERMQRRIDRVLEAEQAAAQVAARRRSDLRARLIEFEDCAAHVTVWLADRCRFDGQVIGVGSDHVELRGSSGPVVITSGRIVAIEAR